MEYFGFTGKFNTKLVDLSSEKISRSIGLTNWAQKENLKTAASIWCRLDDMGLLSDDSRSRRIQELSEQVDQDKTTLQNMENELKNQASIIYHTIIYLDNMVVQNTLNTSGGRYRDQYKKEHEEELKMLLSAKRWLESNGIDLSRLNLQDLTASYDDLLARKEALKEAYFTKNKEYKDLVNMDKSIRDFLNPPEQALPFKVKEHQISR